jgi:hypothetical protein
MRRRHPIAAACLALAALAAMVLAATVSIWFLVPAPVLGAGAYAAWLGMSPQRFVDAFGEDSGGTPPLFPF